VFKDRPYPFGDAAPYKGFSPSARPAGDPEGASTHYLVDHRNTRWLFVDSSCFSVTTCDMSQNPSLASEGVSTQFEWMAKRGQEATAQGKNVFVVTHIPSQDPRDQSYIDPTTFNHTLNKGLDAGTENRRFEEAAEAAGADGVFLGHIKGQWLYRGRGNVPYYIDGGAGGELYTEGPVGAEHGYWHGFRLVRVQGKTITTDAVPIFVKDGITVRGTRRLERGKTARFEAFGRQPVFKDPAKVDALELRDPNPRRRSGGTSAVASATGFVKGGGWIFLPVLLLGAAGLLMRVELPRRRLAPIGPALVLVVLSGAAAAALAQQSTPTDTPKDSLPNPSRMWTTTNPFVLAPVASKTDDARRDRDIQTQDGAFRGRCPGTARVRVDSGFESRASREVTVPSAAGRIIARRGVKLRRRALRRGRKRRVARLRLVQPAEVLVRIRRRGKTVRTLRHACLPARRKAYSFRWDGRIKRRGKLRRARLGRYRVSLQVRSDRRTFSRARKIRLLRRRR